MIITQFIGVWRLRESVTMRFIKWLAFLLALPVWAQSITIKDSAPQVYTVKPGDTLWDISALYLHQPWHWPELWRNNSYIENPHLIYPGDEIRLITNAQGETVIELVRAEKSKPRVKLTPQGRVAPKAIDKAIPVLPWSVIQPYVESDLIMTEADYQQLPRLLGNYKGYFRFVNDELVLSNATQQQGDYTILRQQNLVLDMQGEVLGVQSRHVANARILSTDLQQQLLVQVEQANFEAKRGDRLYPVADIEQQDLQLVAATEQQGFIIDSLEQHRLLGKYDVVTLDLGAGHVEAGTVMGIYIQGPDIRDSDSPVYQGEKGFYQSALFDEAIQQPGFKVGELVIFKVFSKTSYALIIRSSDIIRRGDIVAKP